MTLPHSAGARLRELEARLLLLERLKSSGKAQAPMPLRRTSGRGSAPLSYAQERMWFVDQMLTGEAIYNVPLAVELEGRLQGEILELCLAEIIRRHEVLRTSFLSMDGRCTPVLAPAGPVSLPRVDLRDLPAATRQREAMQLAAAEAWRCFDLQRAPLLRAFWLELEEQSHIVVLTLHHIVSDGWSLGILVQELAELYSAFSRRLASPLPELPVQYSDFAAWQRQWLAGGILEQETAYWRERLAGMPAWLELPTDHPRTSTQTFRGGSCPEVLEPAVTRDLRALALVEGTTLFMLLSAAFQVLLGRYSGQESFALGTPVAGRSRPEVEGLIGFFVNTLVLRAELEGNPTFRELLRRVRKGTLEAFDHQHLPFEKLVVELVPERDLAYSPLFQVTFALQNAPVRAFDLPDLILRVLEIEDQTAKFDLSLSFVEDADSLHGSLQYKRDLFDSATAIRMLTHLRILLAAIVEAPDREIGELVLLSEAERYQLLLEWGSAEEEHRRLRSLTELFEARVEKNPEAPALSFDGESWSYRELNSRANRWARFLRRSGVGPGTVVALCLERSLEMVMGLLAVLKAGGAYLPIDPESPRERKALMLEDSGSLLVLTQTSLLAGLPGQGPRSLCLDGDVVVKDEETGDLTCVVPAEAPAYVIYTSGSTGRPKGVLVSHANVVRLFATTEARFEFGPQDVWTLFHSYAFDFSVWELWGALLYGGRLVIVPHEVSRSPDAFHELLCRQEVTVLNQTPSAFRQLVWAEEAALQRGRGESPELALRLVIFGGEALEIASLAPWFERHGDQRPQLVNMYGITETTVHVTYYRVEQDDLAMPGSTIGRPLPDLEVRLLDARSQPVPVGVPGEIHVGGAGLALGYLGRPDLTAERFTPSPCVGDRAGARLYRSGDLARYWGNGELEYLGRIDHQVKIRGFRIELGEIETALTAHPAVRESVVLVREEAGGDRRLVAYVIGRVEGQPNAVRLQEFLRERLPAYMVPSAFFVLESLPLTVNGKVDRKTLLALREVEPSDADPDAPRGPVEELVGGIFGEVLGVDGVGPSTDFFAHGGHSLLATRVISRLRRVFGIELPLKALFESPTVTGLAARVETALQGTEKVDLPPLARATRECDLPLSFAQQRLWFLHQLEPGSPAYNVPVALRLSGPLDLRVLALTLSTVVCRHEALRTRFEVVEGKPHQVIDPPLQVALPVVDLSGLPERERLASHLTAAEALRPFNLAQGPLLRATVPRLDAADHVVLLTLHHIVSDGWSAGVLVREVSLLYAALLDGHPVPLPDLPIQYADFAVWQRAWLSGDLLEEQVGYWSERLAGAPPVLSLPVDRPRTAERSPQGGQRSALLPVPLSESLAGLSRREGVTVFMLLLGVFQSLLGRLCGQDDLVVGTPIAGRNRLELEPLIGVFVNTLVLRADLSGDPSFLDFLQRVRSVALSAYTHQDLPFELLVDRLHPERNLAYSPLFQAMFVLQNASREVLLLPGLTLAPFAGDDSGDFAAKFDVTLAVEERDSGLAANLVFRRDLFDDATAERMLSHFEIMLVGASRDPERRLSELPLMSEAATAQVLLEWNDTSYLHELHACLHELVEAQIDRTPEAIALELEDMSLSYGELEHRANRLAHKLRSLGVGPEIPVGIAMERSPEMVVGLLAVLKAGGAYVPLDPEYPRERLKLLLADVRPSLILTQRGLEERLPPGGERRLHLDVWDECVRGQEDDRLTTAGSPMNLACILFTSGTTGSPKGVMLPHRGLVNRLLWAQRVYPLDTGDRVLQKASFSFDFSIWELFAPLIAGARVVLAAPGGQRDSSYLVHTIATRGITVTHFIPSMLRVFLQEEGLGSCSCLRTVFSGGEALAFDLQERFFSALTAILRNQYGPTEASIDVSHWRCRRDDQPAPVPIGRPVDNTFLYLVDRALQPVPPGVAGELYIGGEGLARAYFGKPDLSAERFLPSPWAISPGARLYRTGDLARYRSDGRIEYLGRTDRQVKVRGYRIEPREVEAALAGHPKVGSALVLVSESEEPGRSASTVERRLVAYVVPRQGGEVAGTDLRSFLSKSLPAYMVPAFFVVLEALPMSPNGKVDLRALPAPVRERPQWQEAAVAPSSQIETVLAKIWADVLGLEQAGVHDNFFDLGGDSILSIQIVARAHAAGLALSPRQVFQHQTIAELARVALPAAPVTAEQGLVTGPVPLTPIQRRFLEDDPIDPHHFNQALLFACESMPDCRLLEEALDRLLIHHDALRLRFVREPEGWRQLHAPGGTVPFCRVDLTSLPTREGLVSMEVTAAEAQASLDLEQGPLLRVLLFHLGGGAGLRLLLVVHHLVIDGVSWRILLEDLETAYSQLSRGEPVRLPPKTTSFKSWAERLVAHANSPALLSELDEYWSARPSGSIEFLPVHGDLTCNLAGSLHGVEVSLSIEETEALLHEVAASAHAQVHEVLLTALALAFQRQTSRPGLLVDIEGHGREEILEDVDLTRTVGWFTSLFPVWLDPGPGDDPGLALARIKEEMRAVPGRGIGYGLLRYLHADPSVAARLQAGPQSQVVFNYLGRLDNAVDDSSFRFQPAGEPIGPARSPRARLRHLLEVSALIGSDRLLLTFSFSRSVLRADVVEALAADCLANLRKLVEHHRLPGRAEVAPSDFPLAGINWQELQGILGEVDFEVHGD